MITEERINLVKELSEKHGFGSVEYHEDSDELLIVDWGVSIIYEGNVSIHKTVAGNQYRPSFAIYETVGHEMEADVCFHCSHTTFLHAVWAMFARIYEMKLWQEIMEMG